MIEFSEITKNYGNVFAFGTPELRIEPKEGLGLVGNNGAGKTTMLRLILDLTKASSGIIKSKGEPVAMSDHWKSYTGSYLDEGFLIPFLRPGEYLEFVGGLSGLTRADVDLFVEANKDFVDSGVTKGKKLIRELSQGNKNKVGIIAALLIKPEILILDEPFANLDPRSQLWLKNKLRKLRSEGTTLIISSHDLHHITDISSRIILLENGKIIKDTATDYNTLSELEDYFKIPDLL